MKSMKQLLFVCLIGLLLVSVAAGEEKAGSGPSTISQAKFRIALQSGEYDLLTVMLEFPQGAGIPIHMHGGYTLATVVNGEITLKEKGTERIVKAGESWTENPGDQHSALNAGAAPARVVVNMLLPKGAEATTVIKQ